MKKRFTEEQIVRILKEARDGMVTADVCRKHSICEQTFYRWKKRYGDLQASEVTMPCRRSRLCRACLDDFADVPPRTWNTKNQRPLAYVCNSDLATLLGATSTSALRRRWMW